VDKDEEASSSSSSPPRARELATEPTVATSRVVAADIDCQRTRRKL
jgi:hypothetical protein